MTGFSFLIAFIIAIIVMIVLISKFKIHPFLSILTVSVILGLIGGIPLIDIKKPDGTMISGIASVVGQGFSGTFTSIGIVIIFGALIGTILEKTGAAIKLSDMVIRIVGKKHPDLAIMLMGWVVSIPVFCDSGFVILNPIRKALVRRTRVSGVTMAVALSVGLYASHVFIPPTPGPIAAAAALGVGDSLLLIMAFGVLASIPALIGGLLYAKFIGKKVQSAEDVDNEENAKTYEELVAAYGKLPSGIASLAPIIVPVILMAMSNIASILKWTGLARELFTFFGTPIIALAVGVILSILILVERHDFSNLYKYTDETLRVAGPILFVTAAGGVLGKVIASTSLVSFITENAGVFENVGIFFPFLLAAILKSSQGSSTVAITTTAGMLAPLLPVLGFQTPAEIALVVMAIGAGAMTVSHANDSYFWVVTSFSGMTPDQGYKTQTVATLIEGCCSMVVIFILSLLI
ncbi:MAG: GntP family permease [Peptoniphilaceae bacterium]|nr:GntP family permease [Peptoniphilaceae bacterium]MDY5765703.1 GntP family permease [Peptoniphilaceae bacterium]